MHVQQLCRCCKFLWKNQILERNWNDVLRLQPFVRQNLHEVLRWQRVEQRHCKRQMVIHSDLCLPEYELLIVKNLFGVSILHQYPKRLCPSMELGVPLKFFVSFQLEFNPYSRSGDGLDKGRDI